MHLSHLVKTCLCWTLNNTVQSLITTSRPPVITASLWCVIQYHCGTRYVSHRFLSIVPQTYNINSGSYCWKTPFFVVSAGRCVTENQAETQQTCSESTVRQLLCMLRLQQNYSQTVFVVYSLPPSVQRREAGELTEDQLTPLKHGQTTCNKCLQF